jgi:hypothetical protein
MRQFLLGATCGAFTVGVLALILRQYPSTEPEVSRSALAVKNPALTSLPSRNVDAVHAEGPREPSQAEPAKPLLPTVSQTGQPQAGHTSPSQTLAARPSAAVDSIPSISLSAEHARMLSPAPTEGRPPTLQELHMQFATEREDPNWSLEMEQNLNQFLAQSNSAGEFEILTVDCRSTLCEILAFGNLPSSPQRWNAIGSEMGKQPWWSNFKGNSTSSSEKNGRTTIVTILQRAKR